MLNFGIWDMIREAVDGKVYLKIGKTKEMMSGFAEFCLWEIRWRNRRKLHMPNNIFTFICQT